MFPNRETHTRLEEVSRWAAIFAVVLALMLAVAVKTSGAAEPPARVPAAMHEAAQPMIGNLELPIAPAMELWSVLMDHRRGNADAAIAGWSRLRLPAETEVWQHVALAAAYLDVSEFERAAGALDAARAIERDNAVVHYFTGLLRLEQSVRAKDWNDAVGPRNVQLASTHPNDGYSQTRSMLRLAAIEELEKAIRHADGVVRGESLVSAYMSELDAVGPTVDDLLKALGASDYVANSHSTIAGLMLDSGSLLHAEEHLDKAATLGIHFPYAYVELAEQFREVGRHGDAVRAYAKAVKQGQHGGDVVQPTKELFKSLRQAGRDGF